MSTASLGGTFQRFATNFGSRYEPPVRQHLAKVYLLLAATTLAASTGAFLHIAEILNTGILSVIGTLVLVLSLHFYKDNGKNFNTRVSMLLGFGFCSGQTLGPLLQYIMFVNPAIITTALTGTVIIFVSLSFAALLAERGQYLFLGGILISTLNTMALLSLFNIFMKSYFVQQSQLYIGLFAMAGFILFDTQNIVEKRRMGDNDIVQHSLDLFFDAISIFRRLLVILTQKEERERQNKRKQN